MSEANIDFPDWIPARIRGTATEIVRSGLAPLPVVRRLATDPRMHALWQELGKRTREREKYKATEQRFYAAELSPRSLSWKSLADTFVSQAAKVRALGHDARARELEQIAEVAMVLEPHAVRCEPPTDMKHEMAEVSLFVDAVARAADGSETITRAELNRLIALERQNGCLTVAGAYEQLARDPVDSRFIVERRRTEARIEAFVESMALSCQRYFGQDLPGIIATLTNVAFERNDLDRYRIRAILKPKPSPKSA